MAGRLSRALPAIAILAVVSLLVSQGLTWLTVERAADAADRGEVEALARSVELSLRGANGPPSQDRLETVLAIHRERGLLYVAASGRTGVRSAGRPVVDQPPSRPGLTRHGAFIRHAFQPSPPRPQAPPREGRPPRKGHPPRPPGKPPLLVIDAQPSLGAKLHADARVTGIASALAAALFVVLAFVLRRSQLEHDAVMQERARERRLAELGEMASVLSHEIRNPLAALKGHAQLLGESLSGDERKTKKITRIVSEAERLERLTTDLLDFVGTAELRMEAVEPLALVRRAADAVPDAEFEIDAEDPPDTIFCDESRIYQVLLNILRNAVQAAPGERVNVEVTGAPETLVVRVRDRGPGLPPGSETRLFDPFFTTRAKGTGLGLSIAKQIVERHGGSLAAENAPGGGACFCMTLPKEEHKR